MRESPSFSGMGMAPAVKGRAEGRCHSDGTFELSLLTTGKARGLLVLATGHPQ